MKALKAENKTIGLVPTMGALHEGHLSLVNRSKKENDITVVSIFVNPTQFNNPGDLATYPRTETDDVEKLKAAGADYVFIPSVEEVYPEPDTRIFNLGKVSEVMEGKMRPGHFNGVAQIVSKLFMWTEPTRAYFGEKDFQQIAVIKEMVKGEGFLLDIVECEICRDEDGLAKSSRNTRLTPEQREIAPEIYKTLKASLDWKKQGLTPLEVETKVMETLSTVPFIDPEYYEIVNSLTLQRIKTWEEGFEGKGAYPIGCGAFFCGGVRLIDNIKYNE